MDWCGKIIPSNRTHCLWTPLIVSGSDSVVFFTMPIFFVIVAISIYYFLIEMRNTLLYCIVIEMRIIAITFIGTFLNKCDLFKPTHTRCVTFLTTKMQVVLVLPLPFGDVLPNLPLFRFFFL